MARSAYFFYYIKEKGRSAALGRGGNRSSLRPRQDAGDKNTRRAFTFRPLPRASRRASVAWKSVIRTPRIRWPRRARVNCKSLTSANPPKHRKAAGHHGEQILAIGGGCAPRAHRPRRLAPLVSICAAAWMRAMSSGARSDLKFGGSLTHAAAAADDARGASDRAGAGPPISGRRTWSEHARLHRPTITVIIEPPPTPDNNGRSRACR